MPKTEVMHTINRYVLILVALTALAAGPTARAQDALAKQARAILKEHCFVCHGEDGAAEGGLNFILDANRLVSRRIVIPKDPLKSKLYRQVKSGNMPKDLDPLSPVEIETLRKWIEGGARDFNPPTAQRKFISPTDILEFIQADLKKIDANDRPFQRYFTITHLYNAGIPDTELETYRRGLSKLINSLSRAAKIVRPVPTDPALFSLSPGRGERSSCLGHRGGWLQSPQPLLRLLGHGLNGQVLLGPAERVLRVATTGVGADRVGGDLPGCDSAASKTNCSAISKASSGKSFRFNIKTRLWSLHTRTHPNHHPIIRPSW